MAYPMHTHDSATGAKGGGACAAQACDTVAQREGAARKCGRDLSVKGHGKKL